MTWLLELDSRPGIDAWKGSNDLAAESAWYAIALMHDGKQ